MEAEATLPNWIPDRNRFSLPTPPPLALKKLYDFDPMLVLVPSRMDPPKGETSAGYLLCRRAMHSAGLGKEALMENKHPDTWMCFEHSLVPIAPLRSKSGLFIFGDQDMECLIRELKARDTWAITGGPNGDVNELIARIEGEELAAERKQRRDIRDSFYHRGRDAWRSMQARIGARNKRASDKHGHAVTPGKLVP